MKVIIDFEKCIGVGHCARYAPEVFDQQDDGTVILLVESPAPEQEAEVYEAADMCPARAILFDEGG